jgi:hypothetical protein
MIVTKKALSRRTMLRAAGVGLALPVLDCMVPAFARAHAAERARRFAAVYVGNGMIMPHWTPTAEGTGFEFPRIIKGFEPLRDRLLMLTGLRGVSGGGFHASASTRFLTGLPSKPESADIEAGVSLDQVLAREFGRETQLASLEMAMEGRDFAGTCDIGYSCAYTNTISWRSPRTPLPMENNPRIVFERLFGDSGTTDAGRRRATMQSTRSILDAVLERVADLQRDLGAGDRGKLTEYLDAVREVERSIQRAEEQSSRELPIVSKPAAAPAAYDEHAKLMFDLQVLALQSDLTRVTTFMMNREFSGLTFPEIGVFDAHHPVSHHQNDPHKIETCTKINAFQASLVAYFAQKLQSTPDGDGSLLDNMILLYGAGMSDGNAHSPVSLPIMLLGGGSGQLETGGRHLRFSEDTPMANLLIALFGALGMPVDTFGTGIEPLSL